MRNGRILVLVTTPDAELAVALVKELQEIDVDARWVSEDEGDELVRIWEVDAWIFHGVCLN